MSLQIFSGTQHQLESLFLPPCLWGEWLPSPADSPSLGLRSSDSAEPQRVQTHQANASLCTLTAPGRVLRDSSASPLPCLELQSKNNPRGGSREDLFVISMGVSVLASEMPGRGVCFRCPDLGSGLGDLFGVLGQLLCFGPRGCRLVVGGSRSFTGWWKWPRKQRN